MNKNLVFSLLLALLLALPFSAGAAVDINTANAATLAQELPGIGPAKAQAIVDYRKANGTFKSADDLMKVKGIGKKTLDGLRKHISIGGGSAKPSSSSSSSKQNTTPKKK